MHHQPYLDPKCIFVTGVSEAMTRSAGWDERGARDHGYEGSGISEDEGRISG